MKSAFAEWFVAQHGQRNKTYLSDRELHHAIEAGKAAERQLADRELWDQKEQSALYAWAASPQPQPVAPLTPAQRRLLIDEAGNKTDGLNQDDFADEIVLAVERHHGITKKGG